MNKVTLSRKEYMLLISYQEQEYREEKERILSVQREQVGDDDDEIFEYDDPDRWDDENHESIAPEEERNNIGLLRRLLRTDATPH